MNKNYRWGILGAGRIAEKFCTALDFTENAEVYAVASRDGEKAKAYATKYKASKFYDDYLGLMEDPQVDVIYIATPHPFHYEQTLACIQHGKAVVCEKPMSLSYGQTAEMIEAATKNNVFLMEGMWTSCMPFIEKIKSLMGDNGIGKPQYISADFGFTATLDLESRLYNKKLGGGAMMDIGIYPLFLATLVFGEPTLVKAISKLAITGVDEYTHVMLQYANCETAHLFAAINMSTPIEAEIIGTKGRIKINNPWFKATDMDIYLQDGTTEHFTTPHLSNGFEHEIMEVMRCLDQGLLQSEKMPHQLSLSMSKIVEQVLKQSGINYG